MSLAAWLADGADPSQMTPEEVRRQLNLLGVREEQSIACLEALVGEQATLVQRGAATPSPALRRALARRHGRLMSEVEEVDRELSRYGKELAGLRSIQDLLRDGVPLAAPSDCAPLLALLDDAGATDAEFAEQLSSSLRSGEAPKPGRAAASTGPDLMEIWQRMDRGEVASAREALRQQSDDDEAK